MQELSRQNVMAGNHSVYVTGMLNHVRGLF
jgi:hypothetical protein